MLRGGVEAHRPLPLSPFSPDGVLGFGTRGCGDHNLRGDAGESRACISPPTTRVSTVGERGWMNLNIG